MKKEVQEDGTYKVTETAKISFPLESVSKELTVSASFGGIVSNSISFTLKKPIQTISVKQIDDTKHTYYDIDSSSLYIDQYIDDISKNTNYAIININSEPTDHEDELSAPAVSNEYDKNGDNLCVSCSPYEEVPNSYKITVSKHSDLESTIRFSPKSGYSTQKEIFVKKCVPLKSFDLKYNNTVFKGVSTNSLSLIQDESINISVINKDPSNTNDDIEYTLYDSNNNPVSTDKYRVEYDSSTRGCKLSINEIGNYRFEGKAVSYGGSNLLRTAAVSFGINVIESNPVREISFKNSDYRIYTLRNTSIALAGELITDPAMNENTDTIEYTSTNPEVATVDKSSGLVTAVKSGVTTINATAVKGNKTASCLITVSEAINTIELSLDGSGNVLPLGHKGTIVAKVSPSTAQETINSWTSSRPNIISVDSNGNVETKSFDETDPNNNNVVITAKSESGAEKAITITAVPAIRATDIQITPQKVGNCALKNEGNGIYSIYKNDTVYIACDLLAPNGAESNDAVIWRVSIAGGGNVTLEEAKASGFLDYKMTGNNLEITSKTNLNMIFTAYTILSGQNISFANISKSITLYSYEKTTKVSFNPSSTSTLIPINGTYEFYVNMEPNTQTNQDVVVAVSNSTGIADVYTEKISLNQYKVTVFARQLGTAVITCYACYDANDPVNTKAVSKNLTVTVANDIANATVYNIYDVYYKGSSYGIKDFPYLQVMFGNVVLVNNTDYKISFQNSTNAGFATVTIKGNSNNYQGTKTVQFRILPKAINGGDVTGTVSDLTYNGTALVPSKVTVKDATRNKTLVQGTDYVITGYGNNVNAGVGYVYISGCGNYTGSIAIPFTIKPQAISSSSVKVAAISNKTYTGKSLKPAPTVTYNGVTLRNGVDYTLSYSNNKNVGTAKITITGIGNFSGTRTVSFKIVAPAAPSGSKKVNGEYINSKQKKASISKLSKGKKSFKASWKKVSGITGYQIQYNTSSKFTKSTTKTITISKSKTTSSTVKKLKGGKKYYVRIRTYKNTKFQGKTVKVFSSWSKSKTVTPKK